MQSQRKKGTSGAGALRRLPAVSRLLAGRPFAPLIRDLGRELVTDLLREELARLRTAVREGRLSGSTLARATSAASTARAVATAARRLLAPRPRTVINATGVVVHTNLGRSLLSPEAAGRVARMAESYVDLEYDTERGARGSRLDHLGPLMARLFPGQAFTVVNNNAAAVLLCLRALSRGREVLISRGELVEIGGSFRVPDILAASGARLREVGTTNRTRVADYEAALGDRTGLILKVHSSNFKVVGFTEETSIRSLSKLARRAGIPLVVDWGSGDLVDLEPLAIRDELPVGEVLAAGADLVTFSGDKLLGGPQAGFVVGREDLVSRLKRNPLARVTRLDRLLLAALHETLAAYVAGRAFDEVPTLRMLALDASEIGRRAERLRRTTGRLVGRRDLLEIVDGVSRTGGGSSPTGERPTRLLAVRSPRGDAAGLERRLREGEPPIVARIREGRLLIDLRTVLPEQDETLARRLAEALDAEAAARGATRDAIKR
jgi:L-seryl-tRNA(Ser) seleniumtransferase